LYYVDDFKIEYPTTSGNYLSLQQVSEELVTRLKRLFVKNDQGKRVIYGDNELFQADPWFKDYLMFYEYFHGDNGAGLGASHQTGWTGLIANLL